MLSQAGPVHKKAPEWSCRARQEGKSACQGRHQAGLGHLLALSLPIDEGMCRCHSWTDLGSASGLLLLQRWSRCRCLLPLPWQGTLESKPGVRPEQPSPRCASETADLRRCRAPFRRKGRGVGPQKQLRATAGAITTWGFAFLRGSSSTTFPSIHLPPCGV